MAQVAMPARRVAESSRVTVETLATGADNGGEGNDRDRLIAEALSKLDVDADADDRTSWRTCCEPPVRARSRNVTESVTFGNHGRAASIALIQALTPATASSSERSKAADAAARR